MRVLTHNTKIRCPHGFAAVIPQFGHHLTIMGNPALTAEEIEAGTVPCTDQAKCVTLSVVAGKMPHLMASLGAGRALTPVLDTLQVMTNIGPCSVEPDTGSLGADAAPAATQVASAPAPSSPGAAKASSPRDKLFQGVIVPDDMSGKITRPAQVTESEFFRELSNRLANRVNPRVPVRDRLTPGQFEPYFHLGREAILGPDQHQQPLEPWLRDRLKLSPSASLNDYYTAAIGLVDEHNMLVMTQLSQAVSRLPAAETNARGTGEGVDAVSEPEPQLPVALASVMPPPGAVRPSSQDGKDVHLLIQQHYLLTHPANTIMMERWVTWPGGGANIKDLGVGHVGFNDLARVRFALMTKRGLTKLPDILDITQREVYEIKPFGSAAEGNRQLHRNYLGPLADAGIPHMPGSSWRAFPFYHLPGKLVVVTQTPGLILYWIVPRPPEPERVRVPDWVLPLAVLALVFVVILLAPAEGVVATAAAAVAVLLRLLPLAPAVL